MARFRERPLTDKLPVTESPVYGEVSTKENIALVAKVYTRVMEIALIQCVA